MRLVHIIILSTILKTTLINVPFNTPIKQSLIITFYKPNRSHATNDTDITLNNIVSKYIFKRYSCFCTVFGNSCY